MAGIRVETFSIGFGRRLIGFKRGETDYRISLIPLGGYCRFFGEEAFREAIEKDLPAINATKGEFYGATPFRRIAVAVSGPLVNVIFAILVFTIIFWIGFAEPYKEPRIMLSTEILGEPPTMPANKAGLESGDLILAADKTEISSYYELSEYVSLRPNKEIELLVDRNGRQLTLEIIPELNKEFGKAQIGVFPLERPLVVDVIPGSAADKAGLISDDLIVSANGSAIVAGIQLEIAFGNASGGVVELGIERKGMTETVMYDTSLIVNNTGGIRLAYNYPYGRYGGAGGLVSEDGGVTFTTSSKPYGKNGGTFSSTDTPQITWVFPMRISIDASA